MKLHRIAQVVLVTVFAKQGFAVNGAQIFTPVVNNAGTLGLHSSSYGDASRLGIGLNYNLAVDPAEYADSNGELQNYVHSLHIGVGSKIADRIHAFADVSGHYIAPIGSKLENGLKAADDKRFTLGSVKLGVGFSIVDNSAGGIGLGVIPHVVLPVGGKNFYLGGPQADAKERDFKNDLQFGGTVAIDYRILHGDLALINVGWDHRAGNNVVTWGFAYEKALGATASHAMILELRGENELSDSKTPGPAQDPVEADLAYRGYCHERKLSYTVGVGRGFNNAVGSPDLRVLAGLSWQMGTKDSVMEQASAPAIEEPKALPPPPKPTPTEEKIAALEQKTLKVSKLYFANNKDEILEKSYPALDKLAADLITNSGLKKLSIEGHTDSVGNADYNRSLSQKRAESVKKYLQGRGVEEKRMEAEGKGSDAPVDSNDTPAGRANNRRVEFHILEVDGPIKMDVSE